MNRKADSGKGYHVKITKGPDNDVILDEYLSKHDNITIAQHRDVSREYTSLDMKESRFRIGSTTTIITIKEDCRKITYAKPTSSKGSKKYRKVAQQQSAK